MLNIFKPNWLVIDYNHLSGKFTTYIDYIKHSTLQELCDLYGVYREGLKKDKYGSVYYLSDYDFIDEEPIAAEGGEKLGRRNLAQIIFIPARKIKKVHEYLRMGKTNSIYGLYDSIN